MTPVEDKKEKNKISQRKRRAEGGKELDRLYIENKRKDKRYREKEYLLNKERRKTPEGWAKALLPKIRRRAKIKGLEFNLSYEDIIPPEKCPVLNVKLELLKEKPDKNFFRGKAYRYTPSVDRIDNNKGYTKDNIKVISLRANMLKADGVLEEFEKIVKYIKGELL